MQTRTLGRTGMAVGAISLGTEYLLGQSRADITRVIHAAVERGVNYYDVFWSQPDFREHLGAAFAGRRERVLLTAHLGAVMEGPQYAISREPALCERFFTDYLRLVGTDYVDVLFLHNSNDEADLDALFASGGLLEQAQRHVRKGKARAIGISGHNAATARRAVESGAIDVLMFPINLTSQVVPGFKELLTACQQHNVALVAMKVFAGGRLLREETTLEVDDYLMGRAETSGGPTRFAVEHAATPLQCLSYVLDQRAVSTTVPGCRSVAELDSVLAYYGASAAERDYADLMPAFAHYPQGQCVYCNHCLPCAVDLNIGAIMRLLDEAGGAPTPEQRTAYAALEGRASDCIQCGNCEERCPFGVSVIDRMQAAATLYE